MSGIQGKFSQFPFGFNNGVTIRGLPVVNAHSNLVVWVDSNHGNDGNPGTVGLPFATVAGAIKAVNNVSNSLTGRVGNTNNGVIIMLKPYHAETLAAATTYALASCTIVGVSSGDGDMPTFTLTTMGSASIVLGAADMMLKNVKIVDNVGVITCVTMAATGCVVDSCKFLNGSTYWTNGVNVAGGGANKADRCHVTNNYFVSSGATTAIVINEVDDKVVISGNIILGTITVPIYNITGNVLTNLAILNNYVVTTVNNAVVLDIVSACTGIIGGNHLNSVGTPTASKGSLISTGDNTLATTAF